MRLRDAVAGTFLAGLTASSVLIPLRGVTPEARPLPSTIAGGAAEWIGARAIAATAEAPKAPPAPSSATLLPAVPTVYIVATNGNNANAGTLAAPWATLAYAVSSASPVVGGDTVKVRAGTYTQVVEFQKSGTAGNQIVVRPYGDGEVIIAPSLANRACTVNVASPDPNVAIKIFQARDRITIKGLTVEGGVYVQGTFFLPESAPQQWWAEGATPDPGRGQVRDSVAARTSFYSAMSAEWGGTWNPADSIILDSLKVSGRGITLQLAQYPVVTNNEVGPVPCGNGPGIYVTFSTQFGRIESNYVHNIGYPVSGDAHWMIECIRTAANAAYNRIYNNFTEHCGDVPPLTAVSGNAITFDAGSFWNDVRYNTCAFAGRRCFHNQKYTRGNVWHHNLARNAGADAFMFRPSGTAGEDITGNAYAREAPQPWTPQLHTVYCNRATGTPSANADAAINNAWRNDFKWNYFKKVSLSTLETYWVQKENKWEGKTSPPPPVSGNAPTGVQNDTTAFKINCGAVGSTLSTAGGQDNAGGPPPPPPPPSGPGRADLWLPFTTRDATNLTHADLSKNDYDFVEPGGNVLLVTNVFDDSTSDPTSGDFGGAAVNDYLYRAITDAPAIRAYRDSMTVMARVWMDSSSLAASAIIVRTGTSKPFQMLADSSTSRVRLVFADSLTGTNRSCGGGTGTANSLLKETWHFAAARYRTWGADSSTVDIYYGRPGQTVTTLQEHCVVAGDMHLHTGAVDNIAVGRSPNLATQAWLGRIDEVYLSGRYLTKAAIDSAFLRGIASIEPAATQVPNTPTVTAFAMVSGTKVDVNLTGNTYSDPDGDAHVSSTWHITNTKLATEVHSETDAAAPLTTHRINGRVQEAGDYTAKVQYTSADGGVSALSAASASLHVPVVAPDSLGLTQLTGTSVRVTLFPATTRTDATHSLQRATASDGPWTQLSDNTTLSRDATGLTANTWYYFQARSKTPSVSYADADSSAASAVDSIRIAAPAPTDSLALAVLIERSTALAADSSGFSRHGTATGVTLAPGEYAGLRGAKSGEWKPASTSRLSFTDQAGLQAATGVGATVLVKRRAGVVTNQWLIGQKGSWELTLQGGRTPQLALTNTSSTVTTVLGTAIACKSGDASCSANVDTIPRYIHATYDGASVRLWVCEKGATCILNKSLATAIGSLFNSTSAVTLGARPTTGSNYDMVFDGHLDDAAVYRNRAPDDAVIQSISTNGLAWLLRGTVGQRAPETPTSPTTSNITALGATFTVDTTTTVGYYDADGDKLARTCYLVSIPGAEGYSPVHDQCDAINLSSLTWSGGSSNTAYVWQAAFEDTRGIRGPYTATAAFTTLAAPVGPAPTASEIIAYQPFKTKFYAADQPESVQIQPYESRVLDLDFAEQLGDDNIQFNAADVTAVDAGGTAISGFIASRTLDAGGDSYLVRIDPGTFRGLAKLEVNAESQSGEVYGMVLYIQVREDLTPERLAKRKSSRLRYAVDFSTGTTSTLTSASVAVVDPEGSADSEAITDATIVGRTVEFWAEPTDEAGTWSATFRAAASNGDRLESDVYLTQR